MTYNEKKSLYESIMKDVSKTLKTKLNEMGGVMPVPVSEDNGIFFMMTDTKITEEPTILEDFCQHMNELDKDYSMRLEKFQGKYILYVSLNDEYARIDSTIHYMYKCFREKLNKKYDSFYIRIVLTLSINGYNLLGSMLFRDKPEKEVKIILGKLLGFINEIDWIYSFDAIIYNLIAVKKRNGQIKI